MIIRFILFGIFLTVATYVSAAEQFQLSFKLTQNGKIIEQGNAVISQKLHSWNKGIKSSYLKLRCHELKSGVMQKRYTTVDHFNGLVVTHQLVENNVKLTVVRNVVQPRLIEIRALTKSECREMSPVVSTTTQVYSFHVNDSIIESSLFGENMTFQVTLKPVSKIR